MVIGLDVRRADQVDPARVDDDELGALAKPLLHPRGEHRVTVGGFAPITIITSAWSTDSKSWVPADSPNVCLRPYPVGEWQTRAHVSTLLLPNAARTIFWTT